nr:MAG TPA: hypothetical protein [Caudoviricetes sp.]
MRNNPLYFARKCLQALSAASLSPYTPWPVLALLRPSLPPPLPFIGR